MGAFINHRKKNGNLGDIVCSVCRKKSSVYYMLNTDEIKYNANITTEMITKDVSLYEDVEVYLAICKNCLTNMIENIDKATLEECN